MQITNPLPFLNQRHVNLVCFPVGSLILPMSLLEGSYGLCVRGENLNAEIWCKTLFFILLPLALIPHFGRVNPLHKRMWNEDLD